MALAYLLAEENLEIKLEFSKRFLAFILSRPNAPPNFVKQVTRESICSFCMASDSNLNRQVGKNAWRAC